MLYDASDGKETAPGSALARAAHCVADLVLAIMKAVIASKRGNRVKWRTLGREKCNMTKDERIMKELHSHMREHGSIGVSTR